MSGDIYLPSFLPSFPYRPANLCRHRIETVARSPTRLPTHERHVPHLVQYYATHPAVIFYFFLFF